MPSGGPPYYGKWSVMDVFEARIDNTWPAPTPYATNLITPTSIASTGAGNSSSIGANGSVTFSSCATLSLNGVFSNDYENYIIQLKGLASTTHTPGFRLRQSGTDATSSDYTYQYVYANDASLTAARATSLEVYPISMSTSRQNAMEQFIYAPFLARPTAGRSITVAQTSGSQIWDLVWTHALSASYDGFSFVAGPTLTMTGEISVYGLGG